MNGGLHTFGVYALPASPNEEPSGSQDGAIELIPGLWYFDSYLHEYPESRHRIDALIERGANKKRSGR
jgi:hypothetical protein